MIHCAKGTIVVCLDGLDFLDFGHDGIYNTSIVSEMFAICIHYGLASRLIPMTTGYTVAYPYCNVLL